MADSQISRTTKTHRASRSQPWWLGYVAAVALVTLATLLKPGLESLFGELPTYLTFYPAVILVAMGWGPRPGVLTIFLSYISVDFFFITPYVLGLANFNQVVAASLFVMSGLLICWMAELLNRARLRQAASEREFLLQAMSEGVPDPLFIKDNDSRMILANAAALRAIGKPADRILGHTDAEFHDDPAVGRVIMANDRRVIESGQPAVIEEFLPGPEGVRIFLSIKTPWRDAKGRIIGIIGSARDITDGKRSEDALRQSEERYRATFDRAAMGIVEVDSQLRLLAANDYVQRILGYSLSELLGKTIYDLTYSEDRARSDELNAELLDGRLDQLDYEKRYVRRDGFPLWLHVTVSAIRDSAGRLERAIGTLEDISERKLAEDALRQSEAGLTAAQRLAHVGSWQWDIQNDRASWSEETFRIFGLPHDVPRDSLKQHRTSFVEMIHPEDRQRVDQALTDALNGTTEYNLDYRLRLPDGTEKVIHAQAEVIRGSDGKPSMMLGTIHDVTERKRAEEDLRRANQTLEQRVAEQTAEVRKRAQQLQALAVQLARSEQQERRRLAQVLHDHLQQLLVAAKFNSRVLQTSPLQESLKRAVYEIDGLLDESIAVSRSLTAELCPPVLYKGAFAAALRWLGEWMRDKYGLMVRVEADEQANPTAEEIRILLFQAVKEMLFNVVKHAQVGSALVRLEQDRSGAARILVADEGAGFDPHARSSSDAGGTGLGLFAITERLEMLGGRLEIDSAPGKGTRMTIVSPLDVSISTAPREIETLVGASLGQHPESFPPGENTGKIRVLLADDHAVVRDGLSRLLHTQPDMYVVAQACDGREAVDLARELRPDVIIMDVSMPVLDGIQATRRVVQEMSGVRVIGLSMHNEQGVADEMAGAGATGYLTKTCPPETLLAAIREGASKVSVHSPSI